jgi:hypothetical protein
MAKAPARIRPYNRVWRAWKTSGKCFSRAADSRANKGRLANKARDSSSSGAASKAVSRDSKGNRANRASKGKDNRGKDNRARVANKVKVNRVSRGNNRAAGRVALWAPAPVSMAAAMEAATGWDRMVM